MRIKIFVLLCLTAIMQFTGVTPLKASHYYYKQLSLKDGVTFSREMYPDRQTGICMDRNEGWNKPI